MIFNLLIIAVLGYLMGSFPTAFLITKLLKKGNITELGTKNAGATNVAIIAGLKPSIITGAIDFSKGFFLIVLIKIIFSDWNLVYLIIGGSFAIVGHLYPLFTKFKGGKGHATFAGVIMGINYVIGIICAVIYLISIFITDQAGLGMMIICITFPIFLIIFGFSVGQSLTIVPAMLLMIWKNRFNIRKIGKRDELGWRDFFKNRKKN
jgi:glycerol-3-phosphate acyltransferase PlsY